MMIVLAIFSPLAFAAIEPIDKIVAIVNDDVVTSNELDFRMDVIKEQMQAAKVEVPSDVLMRPQVLDRVIEQMLALQAAKRYGITVDDEMLNKAVGNVARNNNTTVSGLREMLEKDGVDYTSFLDDLRRQVTVQRVEQGLISSKINLSEEEINHQYNQIMKSSNQNKQYRLGHVLISLPKDPSADQLAAAQQKAQEAQAGLETNTNFFDVALKYSDSKDVLNQSDLGLRKAAELPTLFAEEVNGMKVGDVRGPIRSSSGLHLIKLLEVKDDKALAQTKVVEEYLARHILIATTRLRNEEESKKLIESVYTKLQNGEDFATLAKAYSDDTGSKLDGGKLNWTQPRAFTPAFAETMVKLPKGKISAPVKSEFGWHIIEVLDTRSRDVSDSMLKAKIQEQMYQRKFNEALQNWYTQLRDEASVNIL
jgi:peptidyl-prolyl cis-trans isomerase SurA